MVTKKMLKSALKNRNEVVDVLDELNSLLSKRVSQLEGFVSKYEAKITQQCDTIDNLNKKLFVQAESISVDAISMKLKDDTISEMAERIDKLVETLDSYRRPTEIGGVRFTSNVRMAVPGDGVTTEEILEAIKQDVARSEIPSGDYPLFGGMFGSGGTLISKYEDGNVVVRGENKVPTYEEITADCAGECDSVGTPECPFFVEELAKKEAEAIADLHDNPEAEEARDSEVFAPEDTPKKSYAKTGSARKKTTNFVKEN